MRVAEAVPLSGTPTSIAAAGDRAWTINADDQTITEISGEGRVVRKFAAGASPVDLAAAGDDLWVAEGRRRHPVPGAAGAQRRAPDRRGKRGPATVAAARRGAGRSRPSRTDGMALAGSEAWAIAGDGTLSAIDQRSDEVVRVLRINAVALATLGRPRLGAHRRRDADSRRRARSASAGAPLDVPGERGGLAAGGGAL